jgi:proteasome accessory factor C
MPARAPAGGRPAAQERLGRLLAIVPWVAAQDGPPIVEVCRRFGITERELLADLELLFLCGVYPFTPDVLIEVDIADGRVWIRFADYFRRPLQLTPPEGLALMGAGVALLGVPGADPDGALARALTKLETVLGVGAGDAVGVELAPVTPGVLAVVQDAAARHQRLEIDYYSFGRDDRSTRTVEPWRVFNAQGQWYLAGWCQQAGGERLFRVDRISRATMLGETFAAPAEAPAPAIFHRSDSDPLVVLDLASGARWVAEQYPNEGVEERPDGRLRVRLRVSEQAWLERLLLRAGPDAAVVEGDASLVKEAAGRILRRYLPG